jgi:hypothetical protein
MSDNQESEIKDYEEKKETYENKKLNKIEKYRKLSKKASKESESRFKTADTIADCIPMGQPVLVGHHSEKKHRRDLNKIHTNMQKGIEAKEKSEYYADKARIVENGYSISSSDPDAVKLLKEKVIELEKKQSFIKKANKEFAKLQKDSNYKLDLTEDGKAKLLETVKINARLFPYYDKPYPAFELTSLSTKIRQAKKRIDELQQFSKVESSGKYTVAGLPDFIHFEKDTIENRFKVYMPKQFYIESDLKEWFPKHGWRYSRTNVCHQRQLNTIGWAEKEVIEKLKELTKGE